MRAQEAERFYMELVARYQRFELEHEATKHAVMLIAQAVERIMECTECDCYGELVEGNVQLALDLLNPLFLSRNPVTF